MANQRIGAYDVPTAERILAAVNELRSSGLLAPGVVQSLLNAQPALQGRPIYVQNASNEQIPAYACMQVTGTAELYGQNYLLVNLPTDTEGSNGIYLFNDHWPIEVGDEGIAQNGKVNFRAFVNSGTITPLDLYRPTIGQWYLTQDDGGQFQAHGPDNIAEFVGKFAELSAGGSGGKIEYTIDSVATADTSSPYNGLKVATVTIEVAPCGYGDLIGDSVEVVDHSQCLFNEENASLVNRYGWAHWGVAESLASGAAAGTLTPCHWCADGLCCP